MAKNALYVTEFLAIAGREVLKIIFNNIMEASLIQSDKDMKIHPAICLHLGRGLKLLRAASEHGT